MLQSRFQITRWRRTRCQSLLHRFHYGSSNDGSLRAEPLEPWTAEAVESKEFLFNIGSPEALGTGGLLEMACLDMIKANSCELLDQQQAKLDVPSTLQQSATMPRAA